jgi:DNA-binding Lrp family transcriptional regulator
LIKIAYKYDKTADKITIMDDLDQKLIALLRQDARLSIATLANKLKVSRGTVTNRMARLEKDGVIAGYTLRLRSDVQTQQIKAWMSIAVEGNRTREVIAILMGEPGVASLMDTNGRWDLLAELRADHLQDLAKVLERIRLLKGISNTETSIHLETYRLS